MANRGFLEAFLQAQATASTPGVDDADNAVRLQQQQSALQLLMTASQRQPQETAQINAALLMNYSNQQHQNAVQLLSALQHQHQHRQVSPTLITAAPVLNVQQRNALLSALQSQPPQAVHTLLAAPLLNAAQQQNTLQRLLPTLLTRQFTLPHAQAAAASSAPAAATTYFDMVGLQTNALAQQLRNLSNQNDSLAATCNNSLLHVLPNNIFLSQLQSTPNAIPTTTQDAQRTAATCAALASCGTKITNTGVVKDEASTKFSHISGQDDDAWSEHYLALSKYTKKCGHSNVPATRNSPDQSLGRWVVMQRRQYQQLQKGKLSNMTQKRIKDLGKLGFVWSTKLDPEELWSLRVGELEAFKAKHGHCLVPQRCAEYPQLGSWVNTQRRHYKLMEEGRSTTSAMTPTRIERLESMGFVWAAKRGAPPGKRSREKVTEEELPHKILEVVESKEDYYPEKKAKKAKSSHDSKYLVLEQNAGRKEQDR